MSVTTWGNKPQLYKLNECVNIGSVLDQSSSVYLV